MLFRSETDQPERTEVGDHPFAVGSGGTTGGVERWMSFFDLVGRYIAFPSYRALGSIDADQSELSLGLVVSCQEEDRKSTRLNSSHALISYAVFCLKKKNTKK